MNLNWKLTKKISTTVPQKLPETPCSDTTSQRWTKLLGPGGHDRSKNKSVWCTGPTNTYGTHAGFFVQSLNDADDLSSGADTEGALSICHVGFIVSHTSDPASVTNLRKIFRPDKLYPSTCTGPHATGLRAYRRLFVRGQRATRLLPATGTRSHYTSRGMSV